MCALVQIIAATTHTHTHTHTHTEVENALEQVTPEKCSFFHGDVKAAL